MRRIQHILPVIIMLVLGTVGVQAQTQRTYQGTFQSVRQLIVRIENRATRFRGDLNIAVDNSRINNTRAEDKW